jgi:hypothetical protein
MREAYLSNNLVSSFFGQTTIIYSLRQCAKHCSQPINAYSFFYPTATNQTHTTIRKFHLSKLPPLKNPAIIHKTFSSTKPCLIIVISYYYIPKPDTMCQTYSSKQLPLNTLIRYNCKHEAYLSTNPYLIILISYYYNPKA